MCTWVLDLVLPYPVLRIAYGIFHYLNLLYPLILERFCFLHFLEKYTISELRSKLQKASLMISQLRGCLLRRGGDFLSVISLEALDTSRRQFFPFSAFVMSKWSELFYNAWTFVDGKWWISVPTWKHKALIKLLGISSYFHYIFLSAEIFPNFLHLTT